MSLITRRWARFLALLSLCAAVALVPATQALADSSQAASSQEPPAQESSQSSDGWLRYYYKDGKRVTGQFKIGEYWYYFDPARDGAMVWDEFVTFPDQDKTVYYNRSGQMLYGLQTIGDHTYYFSPGTGAMAVDTFVTLKDAGQTLYFDAEGRVAHGQKKIDGNWYFFDPETGAMARESFVTIADQGKTVYYDADGHMVHGSVSIDGWAYTFNSVSGALEDVTHAGGTSYFVPNSASYVAEATLDGERLVITAVFGGNGFETRTFRVTDQTSFSVSSGLAESVTVDLQTFAAALGARDGLGLELVAQGDELVSAHLGN